MEQSRWIIGIQTIDHEQSDYELCIYDASKDVTFPAKQVGAHLRRLSVISGSEYLGKPDSKEPDLPETVFQCMVFESTDDFLAYARGDEGDRAVRVKMFSDPNRYMFCPIEK